MDFPIRPVTQQPLSKELNGHFVEEDGLVDVREFTIEENDEFATIAEAADASQDYFTGAASTLNHYQRHLREYRQVMILHFLRIGRGGELHSRDPTSNSTDDVFFTHDVEALASQMRFYLVWCVRKIRPLRLQDTKPSIGTILGRRFSMWYWTLQKSRDPPDRSRFWAATSKAIHYAAKEFGVNMQQRPKPYFGKPELRHLIDYDMDSIVSIAGMEQQHLAWCIGAVCGVRPSSLGTMRYHKDRFLRWRDIRITRDISPGRDFEGRFTVVITFQTLKGSMDHVDERTSQWAKLVLTVTSARSADNIPLSPSHRLLAILLRRELLQDYRSVDELFEGREYLIRIRSDALDQPIFFAGGSRALSTIGRPATATSFSTYLKNVASKAGYGESCTMYAWRRKAGTEVYRAVGLEKTRHFMAHRPGSNTFEKYYDEGEYDLDVTAIMMGEDHHAGASDLRAVSHPALFRCSLPTRGGFQERTFVAAFIKQDQEFQKLNGEGDVEGAYRLRLKLSRMGLQAFRDYYLKLHQQQFTIDQLEERKREFAQPSKLMSAVRLKATQIEEELGSVASNEIGNNKQAGDARDADELVEDDEFLDAEDEFEGFSDNENEVQRSANVQTDDMDGADGLEYSPAMAFLQQAKSFMVYLLEAKTTVGVLTKCDMCEEDESVSEQDKARLWASPKIGLHQRSSYHNGLSRWTRLANLRAEREGTFRCPFPDCVKTYKHFVALLKHARKDLKKTVMTPHRAAVLEAGFDDPDFCTASHTESHMKTRDAYEARRFHIAKRKEVEDLPSTRTRKQQVIDRDFLIGPNSIPQLIPFSKVPRTPKAEIAALSIQYIKYHGGDHTRLLTNQGLQQAKESLEAVARPKRGLEINFGFDQGMDAFKIAFRSPS